MNKFLKALGIIFMFITLPVSLLIYGLIYGLIMLFGGDNE